MLFHHDTLTHHLMNVRHVREILTTKHANPSFSVQETASLEEFRKKNLPALAGDLIQLKNHFSSQFVPTNLSHYLHSTIVHPFLQQQNIILEEQQLSLQLHQLEQEFQRLCENVHSLGKELQVKSSNSNLITLSHKSSEVEKSLERLHAHSLYVAKTIKRSLPRTVTTTPLLEEEEKENSGQNFTENLQSWLQFVH